MNDKIRGNQQRLIKTPGYHIHPQYDLHQTRLIIEERKNKKGGFHLSLAPMVDLFSVLVIYLLINFSTTGEAFFVSKDIKIPKASKGQPLKSFPLVSIFNDKVIFDMEDERKRIVTISEPNDELNPQLREMLRSIKSVNDLVSEEAGSAARQVNLQADRDIEVNEVKKVLRVLIDEGWTGINFVVDPTKTENSTTL